MVLYQKNTLKVIFLQLSTYYDKVCTPMAVYLEYTVERRKNMETKITKEMLIEKISNADLNKKEISMLNEKAKEILGEKKN